MVLLSRPGSPPMESVGVGLAREACRERGHLEVRAWRLRPSQVLTGKNFQARQRLCKGLQARRAQGPLDPSGQVQGGWAEVSVREGIGEGSPWLQMVGKAVPPGPCPTVVRVEEQGGQGPWSSVRGHSGLSLRGVGR